MSVPIIGSAPRPLEISHTHPNDNGTFTNGPLPALAGPIAIIGNGSINVIGGMTTRLAVAACLMPKYMDRMDCNDAATAALIAADVLIGFERDDRTPEKPEAS